MCVFSLFLFVVLLFSLYYSVLHQIMEYLTLSKSSFLTSLVTLHYTSPFLEIVYSLRTESGTFYSYSTGSSVSLMFPPFVSLIYRDTVSTPHPDPLCSGPTIRKLGFSTSEGASSENVTDVSDRGILFYIIYQGRSRDYCTDRGIDINPSF